MSTLFVSRTKTTSHGEIFSVSEHGKVSDIVEGQFEDGTFPPETKSIVGFGKNAKGAARDQSAMSFENMAFTWKRAGEMMQDVQVIRDGICPNDIFQGRLGDCYLLSSLSALAEFPDRLERILINKESSPKGVYSVALNINGDWKLINPDDYFPTNARKITFCHSQTAEIWAMLLEKAYAKVYGGYWNIGTGGFAEDALKDLTGAPTEFGQINESTNAQDLWKKLQYCDKKNYVMVVGSKGQGESKTESGIIEGHAYTLIGCHVLNGQNVGF